MRVRATLLVLLPLLGPALSQKPHADDAAAVEERDALLNARAASPPPSRRPDIGTKDAPVDGLDGKPHAGPFVEPYADADTRKTLTEGAKGQKPVPEDGVMNDPHRRPPRKGTTGTEGGVSEKEKSRIAEHGEASLRPKGRPHAPKEAPSIPPSERSKYTDVDEDDTKSSKPRSGDKSAATDGDKARGAAGIGKPANLPDTPRDGSYLGTSKSSGEYTDNTKSSSTDDDDSDDEEDDEDGAHDFIRWDSLFGSFSSIAATEIGDKTFIVAALMAMRHPRLQVFTAAFSALFVMTILSGITGHAVGAVLSKRWSALLAAILFLGFGLKSLQEGLSMSPDAGVSDEIKEVEAELEEKEADMARRPQGHRRQSSISPYVLESGRADRRSSRMGISKRDDSPSPDSHSPAPKPRSINGIKNLLTLLLSPAWVETFSMTFVGELGDRSQIATVAMAAGQEYLWIMVGATLGHFVCTAGAVIGGSVLAGRVSMRKVTLVGGGIFIAFGIFTLLEAVQYFTL